MPDINAIDRYKHILNQMGNEPEILAERGQKIQDVQPPENEVDDDLNSLLDMVVDELAENKESASSEKGSVDVTDDFSDISFDMDDLDDLDEEPVSEDLSEEEPTDSIDVQDISFDDFDFESLSGETPEENKPEAEESNSSETTAESIDMDEVEDEKLSAVNVLDDFDMPEEVENLDGFDELEEVETLDDFDIPEEVEALDDFDMPEGTESLDDFDEPEEVEAVDDFDMPEEVEALDDFDEPEEVETLGEMEPVDDFGEMEAVENDFTSSGGGNDYEEISDLDSITEPAADQPKEENLFGDDFDFDPDIDTLDTEEFGNEFDLSDFGSDFGLETEEEAEFESLEEEEKELFEAEQAESTIPLELTDEEFARVRKTLAGLPISLQGAITEQIGEKELSGDNLRQLVDKLTRGASARELAVLVGRITGKKIEIPRSYEKSSGEVFLRKQNSLWVTFRDRVWPVFRFVLLGIVVLWGLGLAAYRFLYLPITAENLYKDGLTEIQGDRYPEAESLFMQAWDLNPRSIWMPRYAEVYKTRREYNAARTMYERYLTIEPQNKEGVLELARLLSENHADYTTAENLLKGFLSEEINDFDATFLLGQVYFDHARSDYAFYEEARRIYSILLEQYGVRLDVLEELLEYFIEVGNLEEVRRLKEVFLRENTLPEASLAARMTGFLMNRGDLDDVREILFELLEKDETVPEIHYYLSEYYRNIDDPSEEHKALLKTSYYLDRSPSLNPEQLAYMIRVNKRLGESFLHRESYLQAESQFFQGIQRYEEAYARNILGAESDFGALYANLGDLYFTQNRDFTSADRLYQIAEENRYTSEQMVYRKGYIDYSESNYRDALLNFYLVSEQLPRSRTLMYAMGNTMYLRGNYYGAQGYYNQLLNRLLADEAAIPNLRPDQRSDHEKLVEDIIHVYNNLGVTYQKLSQKGENTNRYSQGLACLTQASEYYDFLMRDRGSLVRPEGINLAYLNMNQMVYPDPLFELQIFRGLPESLEENE